MTWPAVLAVGPLCVFCRMCSCCTSIAYLGRNNLSTAALQMPHDLGFDDRVIGFGAGIFALGYVILEIPGTLIVERWSARRWFTRISRAACTESDVREQVELLLLNHERAR